MRVNKYQPATYERTWEYLMGKGKIPDLHQDDLETSQNPPFPPTNEVQTDQSEQPELDVYGVPVTQDEKPPRVTKSGQAYLSSLKNVVHV